MEIDSENPDLNFLREFLRSRQDVLETVDHLTPEDLTRDAHPATTDDERQCARIAREHGHDDKAFHNAAFQGGFAKAKQRLIEQIAAIDELITTVATKQTEVPQPEPAEFTPKQIDLDILNYLATQTATRTQVEIEAGTDVSKKTVGERLKLLRKARLTERPNGEKGGESITPLGRTKVTPNLPHNDAQG